MFWKHDDLYDMICLGSTKYDGLYDMCRKHDDLYDMICLGSMITAL